MKLLFLSLDRREVTRTVTRLVLAGVRCAVCREAGDCSYGVWVQHEQDFPNALRIWMLHAKPRPLPPWAAVLQSVAPAGEEALGTEGMVFEAEGREQAGFECESAVAALVPCEAKCMAQNSWEAGRGIDGVWEISEG